MQIGKVAYLKGVNEKRSKINDFFDLLEALQLTVLLGRLWYSL